MKRLPLASGVVDELGTAALIRQALEYAPKDGLTVEGMRARIRVLDALEDAEMAQAAVLLLEDADAVILQSCAAAARWREFHRGIVAFGDAVAGMETVSANGGS